MVLKSYAKINLTLLVNKKLKNGYHDIQSLFCLVNLFDTISIKKVKNKKKDKISFVGRYSRNIKNSNNSIKKVLIILRKYNLISNNYSITVNKRILVFSGLGGGTSNGASVLKFLTKKNINPNKLNYIFDDIGSDSRLFQYKQGFQKNLKTIIKFNKKYKLFFLLVFPKIKCSTKKIYSTVKNFSRKKIFLNKQIKSKKQFIKYLKNSKNDLQPIVENRYPIIKKLLFNINQVKGCHLSRMTGSGSVCYGIFSNKKLVKRAKSFLKKKYPKFSYSINESI